jgi:hypothetical protein
MGSVFSLASAAFPEALLLENGVEEAAVKAELDVLDLMLNQLGPIGKFFGTFEALSKGTRT